MQSDSSHSPFYEDNVCSNHFKTRDDDLLGHCFRQKRVKLQIERHDNSLIRWIKFAA